MNAEAVRGSSRLWLVAERVAAGLFLFLSTGALHRVWQLRRTLAALSLLCALFLFVRFFRTIRRTELLRFLPYVLLVAYFALSSLWSTSPRFTPRPHLEMLLSAVVAICLASRYRWKEQLDLYVWPFAAFVVLSFVFVFAFPEYGRMAPTLRADLANRWTGVLADKNLLGHLAALSGMFFLLYGWGKKRSLTFVSWAGAVLSFVLVLGSGSKAAALSVVFTLATMGTVVAYFRTAPSHRKRWLVGITVTAVALLCWLPQRLNALLGLIGRDTTFTGRSPVWRGCLEAAQSKPWFGFGYGGFWAERYDPEASRWPCFFIWNRIDWRPNHAHCAVLDSLVEGGVVGFLLFVYAVGLSAKRAFFACRRGLEQLRPHYDVVLWPLGLFVFLFFSNLVESLLLRKAFIYLIVFLVTAFSLGKDAEQVP